MKRVITKLRYCFLMCVCFMSFSMTAFASSTDEHAGAYTSSGDAIQDILMDGRFQGALHTISGITEFIDIWFIRIISIISFFIISAALLKNACAGAYCANNKFWDKVADAHQKTEAISIANIRNLGQTAGNINAGSIKDFFLGIIPNIKAFTDFEDADIEPKAYWMKAIPQMIACVMIGVFIYNGFYRDTAATVGEMGAVLIDRTLSSVDPESFVNQIFNTTSWPDSPWEKDDSVEGELKQAMFKQLKGAITTNYKDVTTAQQKAQAVNAIVNEIENNDGLKCAIDDIAMMEGNTDYTYRVSGVKSYVSVNIDGDYGRVGSPIVGESDINYNVKFSLNNLVTSTSETSGLDACYVSFTLKIDNNDEGKSATSGVNANGWSVDDVKSAFEGFKPATVSLSQLGLTSGENISSMTTVKTSSKLEFPAGSFGLANFNNMQSTIGKITGNGATLELPEGTRLNVTKETDSDGKVTACYLVVDNGYLQVTGSSAYKQPIKLIWSE